MEKNKIYIPTNIQTEQIIFQGYGIKELGKTLIFSLIMCAGWGILYLFVKSTMQFIFEAMVTIVIGVFIFVKDTTNQSVVDYIKYMIKYAATQRIYRYNNKIEEEEYHLAKRHKEPVVSEQ